MSKFLLIHHPTHLLRLCSGAGGDFSRSLTVQALQQERPLCDLCGLFAQWRDHPQAYGHMGQIALGDR